MALASRVTKIDSLIKRYQTVDPILYEILNGLLSEIKDIPAPVDITSVLAPNVWGNLIQMSNHLAADFTANGGEVWTVVGVATKILRTYTISADGKQLQYSWTIDASTVVTGGLATQLYLKLPPGYKVSTGEKVAGDVFNGGGQNIFIAAVESAIVYATEGTDYVVIMRYNSALFPVAAGVFSTRGTITVPVEKVT